MRADLVAVGCRLVTSHASEENLLAQRSIAVGLRGRDTG
jgi:hypothetical protein